MFRYRHQLRRWAAAALLLWLFGIGCSLAHACLAPALAQAAQGPVATQGDHAHGTLPACHDEAPTDQPATAAKSNCQDFCDKAGVSIPPLKSALDDTQSHALAWPVASFVVPAPAYAPLPDRLPRRDGVAAPPIPIAFLRLTL